MVGTQNAAPDPFIAMCRPNQPAHDPILIVGDANFTAANGVRGGIGTALDPYRIEYWHVLTGVAHGIAVKDTTAYFLIRDVWACGSPPYPYDGMRFDNVTNARVEGFYSIYNGVHIRILNSAGIEIDQVGFTGTYDPWEPSVITGIHVEDSRFVNMTRVDTRWNGQLKVGVSLLRAQDVRIDDSNFMLSDYAISFDLSVGVTIRRAEVGGGYGVLSVGSSDISIEDTLFLQCLGLRLSAARDVSLLRNTFSNNADALVLELAINATVEGNVFRPPSWGDGYGGGLTALRSRDVLVVRNTFWPVWFGVQLKGTTNATVHHNEFRGPRVPAFDDRGPENRWDDGYPGGGNYWSDYGGVDVMSGPNQDQAGSDGIGDTPYVIDPSSLDRYPIYYARYEQRPWGPPVPGLSPLPPIRGAPVEPMSFAISPGNKGLKQTLS